MNDARMHKANGFVAVRRWQGSAVAATAMSRDCRQQDRLPRTSSWVADVSRVVHTLGGSRDKPVSSAGNARLTFIAHGRHLQEGRHEWNAN